MLMEIIIIININFVLDINMFILGGLRIFFNILIINEFMEIGIIKVDILRDRGMLGIGILIVDVFGVFNV